MSRPDDDPVEVLRRWELFGAVWEVVRRSGDEVTVSLRRCDGGEEVSRVVSRDPALLAYVASGESSAVEPASDRLESGSS